MIESCEARAKEVVGARIERSGYRVTVLLGMMILLSFYFWWENPLPRDFFYGVRK